MTVPRVYVEVGDALVSDPYPVARWDTAATPWDSSAGGWSGATPRYSPVECRVRHITIDGGREGALDVFQPVLATISVANDDGWSTWSSSAPGPLVAGSTLRVRAEDVVLFTGQLLRIVDQYSPGARPGADLICHDGLGRLGRIHLPKVAPVGAGDTAAQRIARILDYAGWPAGDAWPAGGRDLEAGGLALTATRLGRSALDECQQAAVTAGGHFWCSPTAVMTYRGGDWLRTNPRSAAPVVRFSTDPVTTTAPPRNLVDTDARASHEDGTTGGWTASGATVAASGAQAAHGFRSLAVTSTAANPYTFGGHNPGVKPGTTYTLMVSFWTPPGSAAWASYLGYATYDAANAIVTNVSWGTSVAPTPGTWTHRRRVVTLSSDARVAKIGLHFSMNGTGVGPTYWQDRVGIFAGDVPSSAWSLPSAVPVAEACATALTPNGPDIERVVNVVELRGQDEGPDPAVTVEVVRRDELSRAAYGETTFPISGLFTTDTTALGTIAARALGLRAQPRPRLDALECSPVAEALDRRDPAPVIGLRYGDRVHADYRDPQGWGWAFETHLHGLTHDIEPSGTDRRAQAWSIGLTLDDASYFVPGPAWDYGTWDTATWATPTPTTTERETPRWD